MQVLTDWVTFPICKDLVPCMEICQLHNCQHIWEDLSRSLLDWLKSFYKALKSSHADTEHPPEGFQTACELLQCVGEGSLGRTWAFLSWAHSTPLLLFEAKMETPSAVCIPHLGRGQWLQRVFSVVFTCCMVSAQCGTAAPSSVCPLGRGILCILSPKYPSLVLTVPWHHFFPSKSKYNIVINNSNYNGDLGGLKSYSQLVSFLDSFNIVTRMQ